MRRLMGFGHRAYTRLTIRGLKIVKKKIAYEVFTLPAESAARYFAGT